MRKTILISNDDGFDAPGIETLISAFKQKYDIFVVAPETEQSGKSHSFTFKTPLNYKKINRNDGVEMYSVSGAPADCVKVALANLMPKMPDFVISGINAGENIGIATFYSGTCAVAREAGFWRIPAVAFSLHSFQDENISEYGNLSLDIFEKLRENGFLDKAGKTIYNVNFPSFHISEIKGVKIVRQSMAYYKDTYVTNENEIRLRANQAGMAEIEPHSEIFDNAANSDGWVTITPILLDGTDGNELEELKKVF